MDKIEFTKEELTAIVNSLLETLGDISSEKADGIVKTVANILASKIPKD